MGRKSKRMLCGVGAVIVALTLAIGGTFAYTLFEHKSNVLKSTYDYQARLIEDFEKNPEWIIGTDIKKEISVKNMGGTERFPGDNWGDIYARVQLKEHMDVTPVNYIYYPEEDTDKNTRFMVDKNGDFVRFPATDEIESQLADIKSDTVWNTVIDEEEKRIAYTKALQVDDFARIKGYHDDQYYWYMVTKEGDPNGQYGVFVAVDKFMDVAHNYSVTYSTRATNVDYSGGMSDYDPDDHETEECNYPVHYWWEGAVTRSNCYLPTHQYVDWNLGSNVILVSEWNGIRVDKWVLDPETGWATWGNVLKPGESTAILLESITPTRKPDGEMFYVIHAEMEVVDYLEMKDDWIFLWSHATW